MIQWISVSLNSLNSVKITLHLGKSPMKSSQMLFNVPFSYWEEFDVIWSLAEISIPETLSYDCSVLV